MNEEKRNKGKKPTPKAQEATSPLSSPNTDPEGSYTGVCEEKDQVPTQDADDL